MVKVNILKSGLFAFEGVHVRMVKEGEDDLTQKWADQICATAWAEFADVEKPSIDVEIEDTKAEVVEKQEQDKEPENGPDWEFVYSMDDKETLDEYAAEFGVKLDRRKSLGKMKAAFKADFKNA
ncbi:MAG: hypothetical protein GOVbin631_19 [Prokaryotic dsDNA virus sp.]|nr:MAG: hypothetical protein GOVbin631_19 [Prokaryotic dsDNA virus sp.]|tara:strand:- start:4301 stop:4672 length:372 start_codon:yes stop_codon:yes gene_type:complete